MPRKSDAPLRVAVYSRVSTDHQTTENQERELQAIAERIGWTVVKVYRDQGVSGAKSRQTGLRSTLSARTPAAASLT